MKIEAGASRQRRRCSPVDDRGRSRHPSYIRTEHYVLEAAKDTSRDPQRLPAEARPDRSRSRGRASEDEGRRCRAGVDRHDWEHVERRSRRHRRAESRAPDGRPTEGPNRGCVERPNFSAESVLLGDAPVRFPRPQPTEGFSSCPTPHRTRAGPVIAAACRARHPHESQEPREDERTRAAHPPRDTRSFTEECQLLLLLGVWPSRFQPRPVRLPLTSATGPGPGSSWP